MGFKNLLLIIDMQNDFCKPTGTLYVEGAQNDVKRLVQFIKTNEDKLDKIVLTQDTHQAFDISHPSFWISDKGESPSPFQIISYADVQSGQWLAKQYHDEALAYIAELEKQNEFPHVIWPEHCIAGSEGAAIEPSLMEVVTEWGRKGRIYDVIQKGNHPLTEHFGALRANIPIAGESSTQLNTDLVNTLQSYDNIIVVGEAKSHCVANTVKQLIDVDGLASKLVVLEDAMSDVTGFEDMGKSIYDTAALQEVTFTTTVDIKL